MENRTDIKRAALDKFYLDAKNPRLGRRQANTDLSQEEILGLMRNWVLDELAVSYLESGFWTHEALLVIEEELDGKSRLVVVEGNRRLAALIYLQQAINGNPDSKKWGLLVENLAKDKLEELKRLFRNIPYIQIDSRRDVESFLGFRHVTGIKQWPPEQKARYITKLIDERGMSYKEVMRKIGSQTPAVRHNYITYRLFLQMADWLEDFSIEDAERRFSVMYNALRTDGVQDYLNIDIFANERASQMPVPKPRQRALENFARWLFGKKAEDLDSIFTDSRHVSDFGKMLEDPQTLQYLEESKNPNFEVARKLMGGEEADFVQHLSEAAANVRIVLTGVHHYKNSEDIQKAVETLGIDVQQLLSIFPHILQKLERTEKED
ncbi:hypothetical protein C6499_19590 [Candidatus Poribacteria bacterium]|nr:MAG: hypothetical protein C6499_19590 [Candidatus Poribacteria bacterium]